MLVDQHINSKLITADVSERLGIWQPAGRRMVWRAVEQHGADLVWQLVDDACMLERVSIDAPRRAIFFELLKEYRTKV